MVGEKFKSRFQFLSLVLSTILVFLLFHPHKSSGQAPDRQALSVDLVVQNIEREFVFKLSGILEISKVNGIRRFVYKKNEAPPWFRAKLSPSNLDHRTIYIKKQGISRFYIQLSSAFLRFYAKEISQQPIKLHVTENSLKVGRHQQLLSLSLDQIQINISGEIRSLISAMKSLVKSNSNAFYWSDHLWSELTQLWRYRPENKKTSREGLSNEYFQDELIARLDRIFPKRGKGCRGLFVSSL
jgi:hypothetical protein